MLATTRPDCDLEMPGTCEITISVKDSSIALE